MSKDIVKKLRGSFLGELLVCHLGDMNLVLPDSTESELRVASIVDGYCIDIDGEFLYLGNELGDIEKAVKIDSIAVVEIASKFEAAFAEIGPDEEMH